MRIRKMSSAYADRQSGDRYCLPEMIKQISTDQMAGCTECECERELIKQSNSLKWDRKPIVNPDNADFADEAEIY